MRVEHLERTRRSVRKCWPQSAVRPRASERAQKRDEHHRCARADERDERTRACPGQRPAEAEHRATREIARARAEHLWCEAEWLAMRPPASAAFDRQARTRGGAPGR